MMLGAESTHSPESENTDWSEAWKHLSGWKRWLTVTGAEHFSFTDLPYLAGQLDLSDPLRGVPQPMLDGPVAAHPEVVLRQR